MKFQFCSLNSGSCGNATYIAAGNTRILIDAGLPGRTIVNALAQIGVMPETLDAILISHEHVDHVHGVGVLSRKYHLPVYANYRTWEAMHRCVGEIPAPQRRIFETEADFFVGDLAVMPFRIPHDTQDPVAFRVYYGAHSAAVATDMGYVPKPVLSHLAGADLVLLESNHDPDMLQQNVRYPLSLKKRILGNRGHLSNQACAETMLRLLDTGVHHALLGHLSQDNNTPELAMRTVVEELVKRGLQPGQDVFVDMTFRDRIGGLFTIE